jgi:diketogulonate reductase-like aldo/keto reductase
VKATLEVPVVRPTLSLYVLMLHKSMCTQIKSVAEELGITPAQVHLSWHVQRGVRTYFLPT